MTPKEAAAKLPTLNVQALVRLAIARALDEQENSLCRAAEVLGLTPWSLRRRLQRLEIDPQRPYG